MIQSIKLMLLGLLVMLVGISWLISVGTALPGKGNTTISPLVGMFYSHTTCVTGPSGTICTADPDPASSLIQIVETQEGLALLVILAGMGIALVGYFRKEQPPSPKPPASMGTDPGGASSASTEVSGTSEIQPDVV